MSPTRDALREQIRDLVWVANSREERGVTASEVYETLTERGIEAADRTVRDLLKDMYEDGALNRVKGESGNRGRPPWYYYHPDYDPGDLDLDTGDTVELVDMDDVELGETTDREAKQQEVEKQEEAAAEGPREFPLMNEIRRDHLDRSEYATLVREVAPEFAKEDPRDLLVEMAEWLVETVDDLGTQTHEAYTRGAIDEFRDKKYELEGLVRFAEWYFGRLFRVDYHPETGEDILTVPDADEMYAKEEDVDVDDLPSPSLDRDSIRTRLEERVIGDRVAEVWDPEPVSSAAGADSSIAAVGIPARSNPIVRKTRIELYTGAAALRQQGRSYTDYDFESESLRRYRRRDAFVEGLMASPSLRGLTDSEIQKSRYAALDLRLYNQIIRIIEDEAQWLPVGSADDPGEDLVPDVVYGDGRIAPLVHQISDYGQTGLYGELARNEMRRFARLMTRIDTDPLVDTVFAGIVKRSQLTWLAPLLFYYIEAHSDELETSQEQGDGIARRRIYQPPFNDSVVAHLLFDELSETQNDVNAKAFVTFRVKRRYYDYSLSRDRDLPLELPQSGERFDDDTDPDQWKAFFEEFVAAREERGFDTIDADEYDHFAYLCARVANVMAYAAPTTLYDTEGREPLLIPRTEVAIPAPETGRDELETAVEWFVQNHDFDTAHAHDEYSTLEDAPVLVPGVIKESDEAAKFHRDHVGSDFEKQFRQYIMEARDLETDNKSSN
jgi:hypothetical protein